MKEIIQIVLKLLQWVNDGTNDSLAGFISIVKLSVVVTPFIYIWEKINAWGIENEDYILIVLGAILIDWIFGTIKHVFFTKTFSFKKNAIGLTTKIALAVAGGFLFEGLNTLVSAADFMVVSTKIVTRVIILMYPGISAFENIYIVSGEKFPPKAWMERLQKWNNTLDPTDLTKNNEDERG